MVDVLLFVESPQHDHLDQHADHRCCGQRYGHAKQERTAACSHRCRDIGSNHVEGPVREVDHLHDSKNQGQTGRHKKQGHTELEAVEELFDNQEHEITRRAPLRGE